MGHKSKKIIMEVNEDGCWICVSHSKSRKDGYPRIWHNGKTWRLNRFVYEQHHGKIPEGMVVRHTCDNPACINLDHLTLGTQADNVQDMVDRGRTAHKLTESDVRSILADTQHTQIELGEMFGVAHSQISLIKNRKSWKHIVMETIL